MHVPMLLGCGILLADHLVRVLSAPLRKVEIHLLNGLLHPGLYAPVNLRRIEEEEA